MGNSNTEIIFFFPKKNSSSKLILSFFKPLSTKGLKVLKKDVYFAITSSIKNEYGKY